MMAEKTVTPLPASCAKGGVVTGQALLDLLDHAKTNGYAIPAVNVVTSCSINGCLEAAAKYGGPMIIQFSRGGGQFYAGKAANNDNDAACIAGTIAVRAPPPIIRVDHSGSSHAAAAAEAVAAARARTAGAAPGRNPEDSASARTPSACRPSVGGVSGDMGCPVAGADSRLPP